MSTQHPQYPPQFQPPPPVQHRKPRRWLPWAAGVAAFILGLVIGSAGGETATSSSPQPTVTMTKTAPAASTTAPTQAPKFGTPKAADFKLTVKTLTKQCFGSAGCNVTFRILVTYNGPTLDPSKEYEVLYEVRGGEDGPVANKLTVADGVSSVDEEEMVSTKKSSVKLTAVVTDVMAS